MLKLSVARGPRVLQSPKPLDRVHSHERVSKDSANTLTLQCQGNDKIENLGKMQAFQQIWIRALEHGVPSCRRWGNGKDTREVEKILKKRVWNADKSRYP